MQNIHNIRFLRFILYFCAVSNFFYACTSAMGEHSKVKTEGFVFDIIYGLGCALNFISDIMMIQALRNLREAKEKFRLFIIWNTLTTCGCYVTDIFQNIFISKHMKLDKDQLGGMDEASARNTIFYFSTFLSTAIFAAKGGILYAFYQMYQNYDQVVADEEARLRGEQQGPSANAPAGAGYMFQQGNPVGVATVGTAAPVALPMGGQQMVPSGWQVVPTGTAPGWPGMPQGMPQGMPEGMPEGIPQGVPQGVPQGMPQGPGMPQAAGQPYYVMIPPPRPLGQQQAAAPNQQMSFASGGIVYMPYYPGVQPQPMAGQPVTAPSTTAEAKTAEPASAKSSPDNKTTPDAPRARASPEHDTPAKATTATSQESSPKVHGPQTEVATADARPGESEHTSEAVAHEKEHGHHHKQHHTPPKRKMSSEPRPPSD